MRMLILALVVLLLIPVAEGINVTCSSSVNCIGDILNRINDCNANGEQFYINTSIDCPDGCDSVAGRCNPAMNIDPNSYIPITNQSCFNNNTLMIEKKEYKCVGNSCKWINNTQYQFCDNGCYENVNELGAECSPSNFNLMIYTMIIFFAFIVIIVSVFKKKKKRRGS